MKREDWTIGEEGIRPAGPQDACLYCGGGLGEQHDPKCVIRSRTVVVEAVFRLVVNVPEAWPANHIEKHLGGRLLNCADNLLVDLERLSARAGCLCDFTEVRFVREASEDDEQTWGIFVEDNKS